MSQCSVYFGGRLTLGVIILKLLIAPINFYYAPEWRWALYPCYLCSVVRDPLGIAIVAIIGNVTLSSLP